MIALEISPGHVRYVQSEVYEQPKVYRDRTKPLQIIPMLPATAEQLSAALGVPRFTVLRHINRLLGAKAIERVPDSWPRKYQVTSPPRP